MGIFKHIESFFKKVEGSGKWEKITNTTLTVIAPILETALSLTVGAPIEGVVATAIKDAQADLAAMSALTGTNGLPLVTQPAMNAVALNIVTMAKGNLETLLANSKLTDPAQQAQFSAVLQAVVAELDAIAAAAPAKKG